MKTTGEWALTTIVRAILNWIKEGVKSLLLAYQRKKADEKTNQEIREGVENAQTDEDLQDALEDAADHLGRRP